MSDRPRQSPANEREDFEGWPQPSWAGDPDEPPASREEREAYARRDEPDERAVESVRPAAAALPELRTTEPEPQEDPQQDSEPAAAHEALIPDPEPEPDPEPTTRPDPLPDPKPTEPEPLDISAEHHEEEQWADEAEAGGAEVDGAEADGAEADEAEQEADEEGEAEAEAEAAPVEEPEPEQAEPEEAAVLEHAGGELDVPSGYSVLEGEPRGEQRSVGIVISRFNGSITNRMLETALDALAEAGVSPDAITVMPVPGAFELPLAAMALAKTRRYACIVALGAVIRGETPHFDFVATEAASGLQLAQIETGVPVAFGVLTCDTVQQAEERLHRSREAVESALEMADVFSKLRASAKTG